MPFSLGRFLIHVKGYMNSYYGYMIQVNKSMEDGTIVAFCHFLADVFAGITKFSLLLQKNETILPRVREMKWNLIFSYDCY